MNTHGMDPVTANPLLGVAMHAIGATFAATCYTPEKRVRGWSWQTYWLTQASFCWCLLPILGAMLTIPQFFVVLREAPKDAMLHSFLLGAAYGIGGHGLRHLHSLHRLLADLCDRGRTVQRAGHLDPADGERHAPGHLQSARRHVDHPGHRHRNPRDRRRRLGRATQERDLSDQQTTGQFSLVRGLLLSLLAGVLSAVYGFALEAGEPIADVASKYGAGVWRGNIVYVFSNTGAFLTTAIYCLWLHARHRTLGELVELPAGGPEASLPVNWAMAIVTGLFWYGQFFFYNLGHVRMGHYKFTSWAIHMIMLVLISNLVGILLREWRACRRLTHRTLAAALAVLIAAVLLLTYGNYAGEPSTAKAEVQSVDVVE